MNQIDPIRLLTALIHREQTKEIVARTETKARRGAELRPWAMGVKPNLVDPDSSLGRDDAGFMTDYAGDMVSGTAVYPIMNAIDSLKAIAELIEWREESVDSHASSLVTMSRMATESAATTIWLLASTDRNMRRGLSVRFTASELNAQRGYHSSTRKAFDVDKLGKQSIEYRQFLEHVRLFDERVVMLERGMQQTPNAKVKGSGDVVVAAAKWLDRHRPQHDGDAGPYGRPFAFEDVAKSFYNVSSAIVHGLKWPLDYMPNGEVDLSRIIVEGVNIAVAMAECAVALFESQAQDWISETDRPLLYPDRLQSTIEEWADLYPADNETEANEC